jgi:hypothetical protein
MFGRRGDVGELRVSGAARAVGLWLGAEEEQ